MNGSQIRAARALLGWTQQELADAAGVSVPTIKRIEPRDGDTGLTEDTAGKIQEALRKAGIDLIRAGEVSGAAGLGVRLSEMPWDAIPQQNVQAMVLNAAMKRIDSILGKIETGELTGQDDETQAAIADVRKLLKRLTA